MAAIYGSNSFYNILNRTADDDGNDFVTFADDIARKSFLL